VTKIVCPCGWVCQAVRAPADGIVVKSEWANGYGNVVYISHGYGYSTRYGHLSNFAVHPGDRVKRVDVLGYVGSTGDTSVNHLHFEYHPGGGGAVDPYQTLLAVC